MNIYLLRHAEAADHGTRGIIRDADRPLTDGGISKMKKVAKAMRDMDLSFDLILSSPYRRAKETARIVGEVMENSSLIKLTPNFVSSAKPGDLIREIVEDYSRKDQLLLVGHEPFLTELISILVSGSHSLSVRLKKGGICRLSIEKLKFGKCATLEWLMGPSQFLF